MNDMNVNKKLSVFAIFILVIIFIYMVFGNLLNYDAAEFTNLFCDEKYLYYNNTDGNVCRYNLEEKSVMLIARKKIIVSYDNGILCCKNNDAYIMMDSSGCKIGTIDFNGGITSLDIYKNNVYYKNENDGNKIYKMGIDGLNETKVTDFPVGRFKVDSGYIVYEMNNDFLYSYNLETKESEKIYGGKYCFDFDIYDNWVYLSDYLMNGALIKINIADHSVDLVGEYGTPAFCVNKNRIFYIPEPDQGNKLPSKLNIYQVGIDGKNAVKITESYK